MESMTVDPLVEAEVPSKSQRLVSLLQVEVTMKCKEMDVPLIGLLTSDKESCEEIRMQCATCIATIAQNNIQVQDQLFQKGVLVKLCQVCVSEKASPALCAKVVIVTQLHNYAIIYFPLSSSLSHLTVPISNNSSHIQSFFQSQRKKTLRAISCLIRGHAVMESLFVDQAATHLLSRAFSICPTSNSGILKYIK
jgi:hypothetical protein